MKVFQNSDAISVSVKINGIKVNEFNTRVNESIISPSAVVGCFNHIPSCCDPMTEELVGNMQKVLALATVKDVLRQGRIEEILIDAQALAATVEIENELEKLKDLLPMVERTKDPSTDKIEEDLAEKYKPCTSYLDLLSNIFASNFVEYGVLKFSARKGH